MKRKDYFYEKRYRRRDGEVLVKRYSRSFPLSGINTTASQEGQTVSRLQTDQQTEETPTAPRSNAREASLSRARSNLRLLSFANPQLNAMLTLTFADNIRDEDEANAYFKKYREAVRAEYPDWAYLGVKEYQKRGAIHFHLLVNFCPAQVHMPLWDNPNQQQSAIWIYGISDYRIIKGDEKWSTELYLLKYLTKNQQRLFRQYYIRSRNLNSIQPSYYPAPEPIHPFAKNIFLEKIENDMFKMNIMSYNYNYKSKPKG